MRLTGRDADAFRRFLRNVDLISRIENMGIGALLAQSLVLRVAPDGLVVVETVFVSNARQVLPLLHNVDRHRALLGAEHPLREEEDPRPNVVLAPARACKRRMSL